MLSFRDSNEDAELIQSHWFFFRVLSMPRRLRSIYPADNIDLNSILESLLAAGQFAFSRATVVSKGEIECPEISVWIVSEVLW